jgi:hydrogenase nickel incorporation protein HypA/HybF
MHELAITESILEIALRSARNTQATKISRINLVIGEYSSIVDNSVQFYWDFVAQGTLAEGALLTFERTPATFHCLSCEQNYSPTEHSYHCPVCNSSSVQLVTGREFYVASIDVDTPVPESQ